MQYAAPPDRTLIGVLRSLLYKFHGQIHWSYFPFLQALYSIERALNADSLLLSILESTADIPWLETAAKFKSRNESRSRITRTNISFCKYVESRLPYKSGAIFERLKKRGSEYSFNCCPKASILRTYNMICTENISSTLKIEWNFTGKLE